MDSQKSWDAGEEEGPEDEVEYAHFLEQFGDSAYRPDGKLKRPEDFTDFRHRELAEQVWREGKQPRGRLTDLVLTPDMAREEPGPSRAVNRLDREPVSPAVEDMLAELQGRQPRAFASLFESGQRRRDDSRDFRLASSEDAAATGSAAGASAAAPDSSDEGAGQGLWERAGNAARNAYSAAEEGAQRLQQEAAEHIFEPSLETFDEYAGRAYRALEKTVVPPAEAFLSGAKAKGEEMLGHVKSAVILQGPGPADYGGAPMISPPIEPRGTPARDRYEAAQAARAEGQQRAQEISDQAVEELSKDPWMARAQGGAWASGGIAAEEAATALVGAPGKVAKGALKGARAAGEVADALTDVGKGVIRRGTVDPADLAASRAAKGLVDAVQDDVPVYAKKGTPGGWLLKKATKKGAKEMINTVADAVQALGARSLTDAPPEHRAVLLGNIQPNDYVGLMVDAGAPLNMIRGDLLRAGVSPEFTGRLMGSAQQRMEQNQQQAGRSGGGYGYGLYGTPGQRPLVQ